MAFFNPLPQIDLKPILELRERFERRTDRDFNRPSDDNASDLLGRYRGGVGFKSARVGGQLVYQYAHDEDWNRARNASAWRSNVLLAFAQTKVGPGTLTAGRQRLALGSERLFGVADWNNVSYAWDGGRYTVGSFDAFALQSGVNPSPNDELQVFGATTTQGPHQVLLAFKNDSRAGDDVLTASELFRGTVGRVRVDAEAAGQAGHRGGASLLAGMVDAVATVPVSRKLTFSAQGTVASGGPRRTFDPLFGSIHDRHGLLDVIGLSNLRDLGLWFRVEPDRLTSVKLQYHAFALDSARGALVNPVGRGSGKYFDPTGSRGRDVGDELDLDARRALNAHQTARAGMGTFVPGHFIRSFAGDGARDQVFLYAQWAYRF